MGEERGRHVSDSPVITVTSHGSEVCVGGTRTAMRRDPQRSWRIRSQFAKGQDCEVKNTR